jgi:hypothetical protein
MNNLRKYNFNLQNLTFNFLVRKQRVWEMIKAVMMMMVTSLQMEPKCGAQINHEHNRLQTTMLMAQMQIHLTGTISWIRI